MQLIQYMIEIRRIGESQVAEFGKSYEVLQGVFDSRELLEKINGLSDLDANSWNRWRDAVEDKLEWVKIQLLRNPSSINPNANDYNTPQLHYSYASGLTTQSFGSVYEYSVNESPWVQGSSAPIAIEPNATGSIVKVRKQDVDEADAERLTTVMFIAPIPSLMNQDIVVNKTASGYTITGLNPSQRYEITLSNKDLEFEHGGSLDTTLAAGISSQTVTTNKDYQYLYIRTLENENSFASFVRKLTTAPVDKTELLELIAAVEDTVKGNRTDESWTAFQNALTAAQAVADDDEATQQQVNDALAALTDAFNGLEDKAVVPADKTALNEKIDAVKETEKGNYTDESWEAFQTALSAAQTIAADDEATQEQVDEALVELSAAFSGLAEKVPVTKAALDEKIDDVKDTSKGDYTDESWAAFQNALSEAVAVSGNTEATQSDVDNALSALAAAYSGLQINPATKTALNDKVDAVKDTQKGNYTDESWTLFQNALTEAQSVLSNAGATQAEVENALDALSAAFDGLTENSTPVTKEALIAKINAIMDTEQGNFTNESWLAFQNALAAAQTVAVNPSATQLEVDSALTVLSNAYESLTEEATTTYLVTVNGGTGGGSFAEGTTVTITAGAPPSGQRFKRWSFQPAVSFVGSTSETSSTAKFAMPAQAVTATAEYEDITYAVVVNGGSGSGNFVAGTTVTITAAEAPIGQRFKQWNMSPSVSFAEGTGAASATAKFAMPAQAVTATAEYEDITYAVTVNSGSGSGSFAANATVTITANPAPGGQRFKQWTISPSVIFVGGTDLTSATAQFTMPACASRT